MDKIEIANDIEENHDEIKIENENNHKSKGAGQLAKEFFKILHETINVKYTKSDGHKDFTDNDGGETKNVDDAEDNPESTEELTENPEERKVFDRKISNIVEYFFGMIRNPKMEGPERVRRKSSCFWVDQSPPDQSCTKDTEGDNYLQLPDSTKAKTFKNDDKLETFKEFLTSTAAAQPTLNKSPRKSLEIFRNTNARIQRKLFSKRSTSTEERQSIFDMLFDTKERRDSGLTKLLNKKQKSLDETTIYGIKQVNEGPSCSNERKDSLVDYLFKKDKSVSFSALLRRFSQDSAEISFIDESPEMKTKESLVDMVMRYMDSFDSYVSKENRRESEAKANTSSSTRAAIAKPDDFQLTPEGEATSRVLQFDIIRKDDIKPMLKDMGTSCDISESLTQESFGSESPEDIVLKEVREGHWIKSEQLQELRKCAEIIFNEVQQGQKPPEAGNTTKQVEVRVEEERDKTEGDTSQHQNQFELKVQKTSVNTSQEELIISVCEQCIAEALLQDKKILPGAMETTFDYDPTVQEEPSLLTERLSVPFVGRELEMINESFEAEESP